jgi:hypothetical protein
MERNEKAWVQIRNHGSTRDLSYEEIQEDNEFLEHLRADDELSSNVGSSDTEGQLARLAAKEKELADVQRLKGQLQSKVVDLTNKRDHLREQHAKAQKAASSRFSEFKSLIRESPSKQKPPVIPEPTKGEGKEFVHLFGSAESKETNE